MNLRTKAKRKKFLDDVFRVFMVGLFSCSVILAVQAFFNAPGILHEILYGAMVGGTGFYLLHRWADAGADD